MWLSAATGEKERQAGLSLGADQWPGGMGSARVKEDVGGSLPPLSFNAMDFPLALEESGNFRGEVMRSWGGGWVTGITWETCWSLGTRYQAGGPIYAPECVQSCVPRPVLSWAQATHHPEWTAAPRARCTLGQQGSQGSREVPSEPGHGYPWPCFSDLSPWAPRRPQCARGCPGPKADTGHRPEAVAALDDQRRGLSRAGAMRQVLSLSTFPDTSILLEHFTGGEISHLKHRFCVHMSQGLSPSSAYVGRVRQVTPAVSRGNAGPRGAVKGFNADSLLEVSSRGHRALLFMELGGGSWQRGDGTPPPRGAQALSEGAVGGPALWLDDLRGV